MGRRGRTSGLIAVLASALILSACTGTPAPTASPTGGAAPTPTPTAEPESYDLVVEAERFVVTDAAGDVELEWAWADDPATIVDDLTDLFEFEPSHEVVTGDGTHIADFDRYAWDGFVLAIAQLERPRGDYFLPSYVEIRAASVGEVEFATGDGLTVGSTVDEVLAVSPPVQEPYWQGGRSYLVDPSEPELLGTDEPTRMVSLVSDTAETAIVLLTAPSLSFSPV